MDVEFWVIDLSSEALGRALAPLGDARLAGTAGDRWTSNGFRVYRVPSAAARAVAESLPMQGQARRDSLAMLSRWSPLSGGRKWDSEVEVWLDQQDWGADSPSSSVAISNGRLTLGAGAFRLLARSWLVAGASDLVLDGPQGYIPAAMVVQLVPQHVDSFRTGRSDLLTGPRLSSPQDEGQVFTRLTLDVVCGQGETLLIVPAHPREKWALGQPATTSLPIERTTRGNSDQPPTIAPRPVDSGPETAEVDEAAAAQEPARADSIGPFVPDLLTLGEAMLTDASVGNAAHRRVILAITPRVPRRFEPLGASSARSEAAQTAPVR